MLPTELSLTGKDISPYVEALGQLRIEVFAEWPYLYEGDLDYEKNYLQTYVRSSHSFIYLLLDKKRVVGATTAILLKDETDEFKTPFVQKNYDINSIVYFGESLLLSEYRGLGYGKIFMQKRIEFAKTFPQVKTVAFCAVQRDHKDPRHPQGYRPLNSFWTQIGFHPVEGLIAQYTWQDIGDSKPTKKPLKFWLKTIR